jgi:hypothetical protein
MVKIFTCLGRAQNETFFKGLSLMLFGSEDNKIIVEICRIFEADNEMSEALFFYFPPIEYDFGLNPLEN